jgi:hypothetical protein
MSDRQRPSDRVAAVGGVIAVVGIAAIGGVVVAGSVVGGDAVVGIAAITAAVGLVVVVGGVIAAAAADAVREKHESVRSRRERRISGGSALEWAGRLLPDAMAEEYIEEWQAWLADLQEAGEPWSRRMVELLVIVLVAAPRLAIICRLDSRRTAD